MQFQAIALSVTAIVQIANDYHTVKTCHRTAIMTNCGVFSFTHMPVKLMKVPEGMKEGTVGQS